MSKSGGKARTKSEIYTEIANNAGLTRKQVGMVIDGLAASIRRDLTKGPKVAVVPGMMKIIVINKPATKARKGINPFTGEETMFKAKPARKVVKVRALKALKDMVK